MSKSIWKISSSSKNLANVVPYTRNDGTSGYYLVTDSGDIISDSKQTDYMRNLEQNMLQQSIKPFDNQMSSNERIEQLKQGKNLFLNIENNPNANYNTPIYTIEKFGKDNVNQNKEIIEKYAQQYNVDADLVKSIMYNEGATGHKIFINDLADKLKISGSQMPMNIQGKTWGNFQGKQYDTYDLLQNIELSIQVIKELVNSLYNPSPDKVGTLWNSTGAMEINDYGARTKTIYNEKPWEK